MCSRTRTTTSTSGCSTEIERLRAALSECDAVVVGAGAGLSTAAGFTYSGERFRRHFADFEEKYGFHDMYTGGFFPFTKPEEFWAYWSRQIYVNRYSDEDNGVYKRLFELVCGKDYFVLTTNVDHQFQKAGFDKTRLFYTQGDYGLFQCSEPCRAETFDNERIIREMFERQENMLVPTELLPTCPYCGKPLTTNLRVDDSFVEDEGWHTASVRYSDFIRSHKDARVLYLELGVGFNTPGIIKLPFQSFTKANPRAVYACLNLGEVFTHRSIEKQSILIDGDISETFALL